MEFVAASKAIIINSFPISSHYMHLARYDLSLGTSAAGALLSTTVVQNYDPMVESLRYSTRAWLARQHTEHYDYHKHNITYC